MIRFAGILLAAMGLIVLGGYWWSGRYDTGPPDQPGVILNTVPEGNAWCSHQETASQESLLEKGVITSILDRRAEGHLTLFTVERSDPATPSLGSRIYRRGRVLFFV